VHLKELALQTGGLSGSRGLVRVRVDLIQRKVPELKSNFIAEFFFDLFDYRVIGFAGRALEIAIFDQRNALCSFANGMAGGLGIAICYSRVIFFSSGKQAKETYDYYYYDGYEFFTQITS
jgi:hypothetical protein